MDKTFKFQMERKKQTAKAKIRELVRNGQAWYCKNRDTILTLAPIAMGGITTVVKVVGRRVNLHKQKEVKELYCYDRSLGHYWQLRRDLSNKEWLEIDARKKKGERLSDILSEMKVLK